jgi:hypothetical protein
MLGFMTQTGSGCIVRWGWDFKQEKNLAIDSNSLIDGKNMLGFYSGNCIQFQARDRET